MAKGIPIVMPTTNHQLCTWHLMQNAEKHVSSLFEDVGVKGVFSKFMHEIDDEEEFRIQLEQMLDRYDARNNLWLEQTFGVKEKWEWPYVINSWAAGMSTTQLSESFNAFLKDYLNCDHSLIEFFMHFERVLYDKRYKELEAEYNLSQKLPRVSIPTLMLKQVAQIYTKTIFEEFQNEYVQSIKASIVGTINDDLPPQYILKRWTKKAGAEYVKDSCGYDVKADVKLHQSNRYRSLMNMFRAIASRAAENEETYHLSLVKGEELSSDEVDCPIQAKELKKRQATSKGKRRIKGRMEKSIVKKKIMQSKQGVYTPQGQSLPPFAMGSNYVEGVYTPQGQSLPPSAMGSNYVEGVYTPQSQSRPPFAMDSNYVEGHGRTIYISQSQSQSRPESLSQPLFAMGRTSVHHVMYPTYDGNNTPQSMPLVYPTQTSFQELLRGTSVQQFAAQLSQASHSLADSHGNNTP
ncbi:protein FAR1-RELATED SEQUENCE 12-like [Camellia sinensis]|uniref:protein FAR1-RELATED SEQUENCE 12-like n=1 Tax=Camellia sinensis TaxID=4442 RepID=UPI001036D482|nr:protein FAR1-RELATED SEQUENCE 12-like [Camellia sinensis]